MIMFASDVAAVLNCIKPVCATRMRNSDNYVDHEIEGSAILGFTLVVEYKYRNVSNKDRTCVFYRYAKLTTLIVTCEYEYKYKMHAYIHVYIHT